MNITKRQITTDAEQKILEGLIVSADFISGIKPVFNQRLLQIPYSKHISKWCFDYHSMYSQAPGKSIEEIFEGERQSLTDEMNESIELFLSKVQHENNFNHQYAVDLAIGYFKLRAVEILKSELTAHVVNNNIQEAEKAIRDFKHIERAEKKGIDILKDTEAVVRALTSEEERLFKMPGDLGRMIGDLNRDDFLAVVGPMKRGKTFWLEEIGIRALMSKLKVFFISLEMTETQMIRRIYQNFLGEPRARHEGAEDDIAIPFFSKENDIEEKLVKKKGLTVAMASRKAKSLSKMINQGKFILACYPTSGINVEGVMNQLDNLEFYESFLPDVIIIDYADILAPERYSPREERHRIDCTWRALRSLAQIRHCLVVTASQSTRATLNRDADASDLAEDIRKLAHVTHMFSLNQNPEDRKNNRMRIKLLAHRHEYYGEEEVIVLQQLRIGKPYLDSRWKKHVKNV